MTIWYSLYTPKCSLMSRRLREPANFPDLNISLFIRQLSSNSVSSILKQTSESLDPFKDLKKAVSHQKSIFKY